MSGGAVVEKEYRSPRRSWDWSLVAGAEHHSRSPVCSGRASGIGWSLSVYSVLPRVEITHVSPQL